MTNSQFSPHNVFTCFVEFPQQRAPICLHNVNCSVCGLQKKFALCQYHPTNVLYSFSSKHSSYRKNKRAKSWNLKTKKRSFRISHFLKVQTEKQNFVRRECQDAGKPV